MGYVAKLTRGAASLDLSSLPYKLADFTPPTTTEVTTYAAGTSANRRGGERAVATRATNRDYSFTVHLLGDSAAELAGAFDDLVLFLAEAGDENDPTYLEFRPDNSVPFDPLWGQYGATRSLEIVAGTALKGSYYGSAQLRSKALPYCTVVLTVKPYAIGRRQRLASATGGIYEDAIGNPTGMIRGVDIPPAITNLVTNQIFGHPTDWDNDWTADAEIIAAQNTDPRFVLFGTSSAKLTCIGTTVADHDFTISVTAANTNDHSFSVYVKKPDGSAVTVLDMALRYASSDLTETFTAVGDGWYRVTATAAGVAAARDFSIRFADYITLYIDGVQAEESAYATPLCYGDLLGCAHTGTAHDSTSTRTAARLRVAVADTISIAEGTVRMVWTPHEDQDFSADFVLLDSRDGTHLNNLRLRFSAATNIFQWLDGTSTAESAAMTWSKRVPLVLHATWHPSGGLDLYLNGASIASAATYTPPAIGSYLYIGTNYLTALPMPGTINGVATYDRAASAAEVLADYTNVVQLARGGDGYGQRVDAIPWVWTKDGDEVIDAYNDATHDDWCVVGGIDGTAPADTAIDLTHTSSGGVVMALNDWPVYLNMADEFYDLSGHVVAGAVGGEVATVSIDTTGANMNSEGAGVVGIVIDTYVDAYFGKNVYALASLSDAGSTLNARVAACYYNLNTPTYSDYKSVGTAAATLKMFFIGPTAAPYRPVRGTEWVGASEELQFYIFCKHTTGTANVSIDFYRILVGNAWTIQGGGTRYVLRNGQVDSFYWDAVASRWIGSPKPDAQGPQALEFVPQRYNHLVCVATDLDANNDITETTTINRIYIWPRWATQ